MTETTPSSRQFGSASWMLKTSVRVSASPVVSTKFSRARSCRYFVHRRFEFPEQRATNASAAESEIRTFCLIDFRIDRDLAEFIHHELRFSRVRGENMTEQGRLTLPSGPVMSVMGVRGVICRKSNIEIRNSKQCPKFKIGMKKRDVENGNRVSESDFEFWTLFRISDFGYSNFLQMTRVLPSRLIHRSARQR